MYEKDWVALDLQRIMEIVASPGRVRDAIAAELDLAGFGDDADGSLILIDEALELARQNGQAARERHLDKPDEPLHTVSPLSQPVVGDQFEIVTAADSAKQDHELHCTDCGECLCDVEHGDSLNCLVMMAMEHVCKPTREDQEAEDE